MKAPCLNVCVSNKDDQRYLVICNIKKYFICSLKSLRVPLQSFVDLYVWRCHQADRNVVSREDAYYEDFQLIAHNHDYCHINLS